MSGEATPEYSIEHRDGPGDQWHRRELHFDSLDDVQALLAKWNETPRTMFLDREFRIVRRTVTPWQAVHIGPHPVKPKPRINIEGEHFTAGRFDS